VPKSSIVSIVPPALKAGDTVAVVAPAGPVDREEFERGCSRLRELGFNPIYSPGIFNTDLYFAGSVKRRADELHQMLRLAEVKAIFCARGGYGSNYLLPLLDFDLFVRNPKIFCGYSDNTTLLTQVHDRTGLPVFHGPMVAKDFARSDGVHAQSFANATGGQACWQIDRSDSPLQVLREGVAEGKLYGGCLSMLVASLGTPYEIETEDTVLFIEDLGEPPYRIDRMLMHLGFAGKMDKVRGIVFGEMCGCNPPADAGYTLQDVLQRTLADLQVPVAFGLRSGHVSAGNITLPIGVRVRLTADKDVKLEMLESATVPRSEPIRVGQS
jgi:muramoyltetrapeptide carboxypeptidase